MDTRSNMLSENFFEKNPTPKPCINLTRKTYSHQYSTLQGGASYHGKDPDIAEQLSVRFWRQLEPLQIDHCEHGVEHTSRHSYGSLYYHYEQHRGDLEERQDSRQVEHSSRIRIYSKLRRGLASFPGHFFSKRTEGRKRGLVLIVSGRGYLGVVIAIVNCIVKVIDFAKLIQSPLDEDVWLYIEQ